MDSNHRTPKRTDLQSARFNHLPTYPKLFVGCRVISFFIVYAMLDGTIAKVLRPEHIKTVFR